MQDQPHYISPDQLCIGLYIHLDRGWMDHPFTFNNFKISSAAQIAQIQALKLEKLRYDPMRSDCEPLSLEHAESHGSAPPEVPAVTPTPDIEASQISGKSERLKLLHESIRTCEKEFMTTSQTVKDALSGLNAKPGTAREAAAALVTHMVESVLTESDIVLHAISDRRSGETGYLHPLNVTVLALMLSKSIDMTPADAHDLGMAAIFHDIGKAEIPDRILLKTDPLNKAEQGLLEQHCATGTRMALQSGLSERAGRIILQHHELMDGSGYPKHLKGEEIDSLARLLAIANTFDNLCNPVNLAAAMTPYEALAHMFSTLRGKFDASLLKILIKSLGVYPPGSVVMLSDNAYGMVISVNPSASLRPYVMLYKPDVARETPEVINLREEPGINIGKCMRPGQLPREVLDYLSPRKRVSYYFNKDTLEIEN